MGLFDDAASAISGSSRKHRSHKSSRDSHSHHHHKGSRHRSRSRESRSGSHYGSYAASIFGGGGNHDKNNASRSSFFGGGNYEKNNASKSSLFNLGNSSRGSFFSFGTGRAPSYYKRSPRQSFMQRAYRKLKRLLRDLVHYAKRHPLKVFMLVVMPLITGGALTALLARFGLRMPAGLESMLGIGAKAMAGDGIGLVGEAVRMASGAGLGSAGSGAASVSLARGWDDDRSWERRSVQSDDWFGGGASGLGSALGGLGGGTSGGWMGSVAKFFS